MTDSGSAPITDEALAALDKLHAAMTPGPLVATDTTTGGCHLYTVKNGTHVASWVSFDNATGIVALRNSYAALRERLRVAEAERDAERTRLLAESNAYLERGVYGKGGPTDIYPDWVYEARDAIRRQNENPPHFLGELCVALGWQGGTYHQMLKAVQRLVGADKDAAAIRTRSEGRPTP